MGLGHGVVFLKQDFEVEKGSICLLKKEIDQQGLPVAYLLARVNDNTKKLIKYGESRHPIKPYTSDPQNRERPWR
jgi:hypothetical protein